MRSFMVTGLVLFAGMWMSPLHASSAVPHACEVMSHDAAAALAGVPLGEAIRHQEDNGDDHTTGCDYFPKAFNLKGKAPPPDGLRLVLHAMTDPQAAKDFYERVLHIDQHLSQGDSSAVQIISDLGGEAYLLDDDTPGYPPHSYVSLHFFKSNVMGAIEVWSKAGHADTIAKAAAKQALVKLP